MASRTEFINLDAAQQTQASARFFNAGVGDGYLYELDKDGIVLCRQRPMDVQGQPRPLWANGRLVHQSTD